VSFSIGIDVGGTFTDLVAVEDTGTTFYEKTLSTRADLSVGVFDGLESLANTIGIDTRSLLERAERIVHGTTVATNALLERKGARVGMLTTWGHRDVLEMREGVKPERYNVRLPHEEPLVSRALRLPVRERIGPDGAEVVPLDRTSLRASLASLRKAGVEAIAICFLHSYRRPHHEQQAARVVSSEFAEAYVSRSSEVLPQIKEYERFGTTVVNAYVGPAVSLYLGRLERKLRRAGYHQQLLVMQSHGGVATVRNATRLAVGAILSGPAGGAAGGRYTGQLVGERNLITLDMGGTSTDVSPIVDGKSNLAVDRFVAGLPVAFPSLDIISLGTGGGSIASVVGELLRVGPTSAGADPGPACYGRGGDRPTVTDANLVLGYLAADNFLGGRLRLDVAAAQRVVGALGERLGTNLHRAAEGIHRVTNTQLAGGIREVSVRRGVDPRGFSLVSYGGAAGLHVTEVARQVGVRRVIVPRVASVLSAWGMLTTDVRHEVTRTHIGDLRRIGQAELRRVFQQLEQEARRQLSPSFRNEALIERAVDMRYGEQVFEITVPLDGIDLADDALLHRIEERFHARHEQLYTYKVPDQDVVIVNARLSAVGKLPSLPMEPRIKSRKTRPRASSRRAFLGAWETLPVYRLEDIPTDYVIRGPAIVESPTTTIVLRSDDEARMLSIGWLDIAVPAE
jgi:N-methylhydantoinase A